jgi:DNA-binding CsgD family transcriptional regulator
MPDTNALIDRIYDAAVDSDAWVEALGATAATLGADGITMFLPAYDDDDRYAHDFATWNLPASSFAMADKLVRETGVRDALTEAGFKKGILKPGLIALGQELVSAREWDENPWSQTLYRDVDLRHYLGFIGRGDGVQAQTMHFSLFRRSDATPFNQEDLAQLERLRPHLERAGRTNFILRARAAQAALSEAALNSLREPIFVLDEVGRILFCNTLAERFLDDDAPVLVEHGRLCAPDLTTQAQLSKAFALCAKGEADEFWLERPRHRDRVRAIATPIQRQGVKAAVLLTLRCGLRRNALARESLMAQFGLSPTEAVVALLLGEGLRAAEAAERQNVAEETIRSQRRSIYQKMQIKTQPALMQIIQSVRG